MTLREMLIEKIGQDIYDQYNGVEAYEYAPEAADYTVTKVYECDYPKQNDYVIIHHIEILNGFHVSTMHSERYYETLDEIDPQVISFLDKYRIRVALGESPERRYYRVTEGEATEIDCTEADEDYNPAETCIAYAENDEQAIGLADMYDRDEIQADNVWCQECNKAHAALSMPDDSRE